MSQRRFPAGARSSAAAIGEQKYLQWQFARQWRKLKAYANVRGVSIVGDMPIFVAYDSADVWANPHLFHLDEKGGRLSWPACRRTISARPASSGATRSTTGSGWQARGYAWWIARMRNDLSLYDMVRIDHFRGFEAYWEVPAAREDRRSTAAGSRGRVRRSSMRCSDALGHLPIIAEDLGVITPEVEALRDRFGFPGMKILQFAFGSGPENPYLPHNHDRPVRRLHRHPRQRHDRRLVRLAEGEGAEGCVSPTSTGTPGTSSGSW